MSIVIKKFSNGTPVDWYWPLQVVVFSETEEARSQFVAGFWSSKLTDVWSEENHPTYPRFPSLVFSTEGSKKLLEEMDDEGQEDDEFTAFIVLEPDINDWFKLSDVDTKAQQLLKLCNTRGLFIIQYPGDVAKWYDDLVVELSHNCSLPEALAKLVTLGYFLYDSELDTATKLSMLLPELKQNLKRQKSSIVKFVNPWDRVQVLTGKEMAAFISANANGFMYHHESGEAEKIAELNRIIYYNKSRDIKGVDYEMAEEYVGTGGGAGSYQMAAPDDPDPGFTTGSATADTESGGGEDWKNSVKPSEPDPDTPRFLQAGIFNKVDELQEELLYTNQIYSIAISIGYPKKDRLRGAQPIQPSVIFDNSDNSEEPIKIVFATNVNNNTQDGEILLPRIGDSKEVCFLFKTSGKTGEFKAEITAFHKNRLIQKALLTGYIAVDGQPNTGQLPGLAMDIVETYRQDLQDLANRSDFSTSLELSENVHGSISFRGISMNNPIELNFSSGLEKLIKEIKNLIENTVINIAQYPENLRDPNVVKLLINLALKGNSLYFDHFRKQKVAEGPIKIISSKAEFIPLDFMYTKPPPLQSATLCEHAEKALEEGKCQGCPGIEKPLATVVCPLGFWCFSKVVERSNKRDPAPGSGDYRVNTEPSTGRDTIDILRNTLFASSDKVYAALPNLKNDLLDAIRKNSQAMVEVPDWNTWRSEMTNRRDVDCLILLVHIEKDKNSGQDNIEIGNGQFQLINYFDEQTVMPASADKPPFIILLGCESNNIGNFEFDLSNRFLNSGAGIVLSSFTKIRGRQAGPIVMKLIEFLKSKAGQSITLGEVLLKMRQHLLARGILSGLSLVSYGDADWKIKT